MICPKCRFDQADGGRECRRCGIIFEKYLAARSMQPFAAPAEVPAPAEIESDPSHDLISAKDFLLSVPYSFNPFSFAGRLLVFCLLVYLGWTLIVTPMETNYAGESFLHNINLPFHEAGI
jgi:hypothetical protein